RSDRSIVFVLPGKHRVLIKEPRRTGRTRPGVRCGDWPKVVVDN
ncbi:MAG: hypothetical protein QOG65_819, partial [Actinomycetota bacterium]|nr:hypothetical protein [Actinomycetota bacterium]